MSEIDKSYKIDKLHDKDYYATASGDFVQVSGIDNVKQRLMHRLMTRKGSLIHRPDFGVGIKDYKNAPLTLSVQQSLALRIKQQMLLDPVVTEVTRVSVKKDGDSIFITASMTIEGHGTLLIEEEV